MRAGLKGILTALTGMSVRAANQVVVVVVTLVAAHFLPPAKFGVFAIAAAITTLIRTLMYNGAFEYLLKAKPGEESPSECLIINFALVVGLTVLMLPLVPLSGHLFGSQDVGRILLALMPSNLISAFAAWQESQLLRAKRVRLYYGITAIAELAAGVIAIALLALHLGLTALIAQVYTRAVFLLVSYSFVQKLAWSERLDRERLIHVFRWASARYGGTLVSFMSGYGADFFLGGFLSPAASGLYRASSRVVTATSDMFSHPAQILSAAIFSKHASRSETPEDIWPRIFAACSFMGWSALAGLAAVSNQIVPFALGPKWAAAGPIVAMICIARGFSLVDSVTNPLLVAYNYAPKIFRIQLFVAAGSTLLIFATARFGVVAVATCTIVTSATYTLAQLWLALRAFPGALAGFRKTAAICFAPPLLTFLGARAGFLLCGQFAHVPPLAELIVGVATGILFWGIAAFALRKSAGDALHALNS